MFNVEDSIGTDLISNRVIAEARLASVRPDRHDRKWTTAPMLVSIGVCDEVGIQCSTFQLLTYWDSTRLLLDLFDGVIGSTQRCFDSFHGKRTFPV